MIISNEYRRGNVSNTPFPFYVKVFFISLALVKLWLVSGQTVSAIGYAIHDDRLFLELANTLVAGKWLGHYDNLTLAKGPFYPIFIAIAFVLNIPLLMAQHILYIGACIVFIIAVRPVLQRPLILLLLYTILLFNPISYADIVMTRVLRGGIYPALTILVAACAIGLLVRKTCPLKNIALWSIGFGFSFSAFWLTREEGIWIIPSILIIAGFALVSIWQNKLIDWRRLSVLFALPFCIWITATGMFASINKMSYGIFTIVDIKSHDFLSAYSALSRVKHAHWVPYIPVPKETRERIYKVSPAFAELKPFLEGDLGKGWSVHGCRALSICDDIASAWFIWALRDAVAGAGHYETGVSSANYYQRLATEINAACANHKLDCEAERSSFMPPWRREYAKPLLNTLVEASLFLSRFENFNAYPSQSEGTEKSLILFKDMTRGRLSPQNTLQCNGWAITPATDINVSVKTSDGSAADADIRIRSKPDVPQHVLSDKGARFNRYKSFFDITTTCTAGCYLHIEAEDRFIARLPLDGSMILLQNPEIYLRINFFGYKKSDLLPRQLKLDHIKITILNFIGRAYQIGMPLLIILSLIAYVITIPYIFLKRIDITLWIINLSLLIAVCARLLILSLVDVTSFPGITTPYLSSAYPLMLLFVLLALTGFARSIFTSINKKNMH